MVNKAVVLFGSSSDLLQSSLSSILRIVESFDLDNITILYSSFAEQQCKELEHLLTESLHGIGISVRCEQINEKFYENHLRQLIDENTILSPTSGSRFYAFAAMKIAVEKRATVVHTMFPFGPWRGMFYPFVPRFIQPIRIMSGNINPRDEVNDIFSDHFKETLNKYLDERFNSSKISSRVCVLSMNINSKHKKNYHDKDGKNELFLDMNSEGVLSLNSDQSDPVLRLKLNIGDASFQMLYKEGEELLGIKENEKNSELFKIVFTKVLGFSSYNENEKVAISFNDIYGILGFGDIVTKGENDAKSSLEEISHQTKGIVVDTNLIYSGILMYKDVKMMIPYCTYVEIANKRSELLKNGDGSRFKNIYGRFLWESLTELMEHNQVLKTEAFFCDGVIPMIDPILIRDCAILTNDEGAYRHWVDIFPRNVKVLKSRQYITKNMSKMLFAFILLSSMVRELKFNELQKE